MGVAGGETDEIVPDWWVVEHAKQVSPCSFIKIRSLVLCVCDHCCYSGVCTALWRLVNSRCGCVLLHPAVQRSPASSA